MKGYLDFMEVGYRVRRTKKKKNCRTREEYEEWEHYEEKWRVYEEEWRVYKDEWRIGREVPSWKRIIPETKPDAKPVAGDYVKVEIPTRRRKSQVIQKGKVQFTRLDDEEV